MGADSGLDQLRKTMVAQGIAVDAPVHETLGPAPDTMALEADQIPRPSVLPEADVGHGPEVEFEILGELGRGGMATVFLANQTVLDREVAIKRAADPEDQEAELLLLREATVMGRLEHPNIVPVHALVLDDTGPAVVMKRISGVSWEWLIQRGETPIERHIEILLQVINAAAFAHSRGVIHRDIKPTNVMIGDFGEVYLVDWGVARRMTDPPSKAIVGTPHYMAPEMAEGLADERTDVFLLGATLHEVLTGEPRHRGEDALTVLYAAVYVEAYRYAESVPQELAEICNRACARDPSARFESALELRDAVLTFRDHRAATLLSDAAEQRLHHLESALCAPQATRPTYAELQRLFGEVRFGFEAALDVWPHHARAGAGLDRCLHTMIDHELSLGHVDAAAALLQSLRNEDPERAQKIARTREFERAERAKLQALQRDHDPRVGAEDRTRAYRVLGLSVLLMTSVLLAQRLLHVRRSTTTLRLLVVGAVVFCIMAGIAAWWRKHGVWNYINKRIAEISVGALAVSLANRLSGYMLDSSPERVLISDAFILGLGGATMAAYHRAGPWLAGVSFGVAIIGSIWPSWVDELYIGLTVFIATTLLLLHGPGKPRDVRAPDHVDDPLGRLK